MASSSLSLPTTASTQPPPQPSTVKPKKDESTPAWLWLLLFVVLFQLGFMILVELQQGTSPTNAAAAGLDFLVLSECHDNQQDMVNLQDIASPALAQALQMKCAEKAALHNNKNNQKASAATHNPHDKHHEHPRLPVPLEQPNHNTLPRIMAIYFPQYHKDPLNNRNWGDNFTDWVSLRNAPERNYLGYPIPRPTNLLGYYLLQP